VGTCETLPVGAWRDDAHREYFRSELELVCRAVEPDEFRGLPFYIIFASERPEFGGTSYGLTAARLHAAIAQEPTYRGAGPALVVNDLSIFADAGNDAWRVMVGIALHETSHIIDGAFAAVLRKKEEASTTPAYSRFVAIQVEDAALHAPAPCITLTQHDWRFIRMAIHVWWRNHTRYFSMVRPEYVFDAKDYGFSDIHEYVDALGSELDGPQLPLSQLRQIPPPQAFAELWNKDLIAHSEFPLLGDLIHGLLIPKVKP
jgi:hypothetical protein